MLELLQLSPPGWGATLLRGALVTLEIAVLSYAIGLVLGLAGAAAKLSGNRVLGWIGELYTTLVRAVPELLLIILLFYGGSTLLDRALIALGFEGALEVSGFATAVAVLGVVQGAYQTEVIRGAILAIPIGQIEAAKAFGMSPALRLRRIVVPGLLPTALPGFANLWLILLKDTALISIVGISELLYVGKQAAGSTHEYFLFYVVVGAIYLAMTLVSNRIFELIESRVRRGIKPA